MPPTLHICVRDPQDEEAIARMRSISGVHITRVDVGPDEEAPWQIPPSVEKSTEIILNASVPSNLNAASSLQFLRGLDFLIIAMPLTGQTEGLIGEAELRALPPHAYVLNPARGPIIQEQALLKALSEGWISGAALDTHYQYPLPQSHPLWQMPNVILTPHISGSSQSQMFSKRVWEIFHDNVQRYRSGQPLLNELSPRQLSETR